MSQIKKPIVSKNAPQAIGPYSQGIEVGNMMFLSGQIPLDPQTGTVSGTTIEEQTERVIKNIEGILKDKNLTLGNVVKTTVFLKDMNEFVRFNEVYGKFFPAPFPARSTVEVARLPKDVKVEIEAIITL
jgi:2-iminobutanoate/2-iminopropanoate deaminase